MSINTQITVNPIEKKEKNNLFFHFTKKFSEQLDLIRMPNKMISTLLSWTEFMPLPSQVLSFIADRRDKIKMVTSTFALPKLFIKQIKLYEACHYLKNRLSARGHVSLDKIVDDVKKKFLAFLSVTIKGIQLPQLLDKARIIDLNKISRMLLGALAKSECLLSLGYYSIKVADKAWILHTQLKSENQALAHWKWNSSPKATRTLIKLSTNSLKVLSNSISVAALFLGLHTNPLISLAVSTLSISVSIIAKITCHRNFFWKDSKRSDVAWASLKNLHSFKDF
jgi:hypothetical protein